MSQTKNCRECREPIDVEATRCPRCQSWQSWRASWSITTPQSLGSQFLIMVVVLVVMLISFKFTFPAAQPEVSFETYKSSVSVEAPSLSFSKDGEREFFAVVGMLKNASDIEWRSPYVEAKFLNAKGDLIDTMSSNLKDVILLPQSSAAFRITGYTARPSSEYAKVEISVTSARSKAKWE